MELGVMERRRRDRLRDRLVEATANPLNNSNNTVHPPAHPRVKPVDPSPPLQADTVLLPDHLPDTPPADTLLLAVLLLGTEASRVNNNKDSMDSRLSSSRGSMDSRRMVRRPEGREA